MDEATEELQLKRWFPANDASVAAARDWVVRVAKATGHAPLSATVELLVSELATNAVRHAGGTRFVVEFDAVQKLVIAVCDASPAPPRARRADDEDTGGRGLEILDKLADQWGVAVSSRGKCVWFQLEDHHPGTVRT